MVCVWCKDGFVHSNSGLCSDCMPKVMDAIFGHDDKALDELCKDDKESELE